MVLGFNIAGKNEMATSRRRNIVSVPQCCHMSTPGTRMDGNSGYAFELVLNGFRTIANTGRTLLVKSPSAKRAVGVVGGNSRVITLVARTDKDDT